MKYTTLLFWSKKAKIWACCCCQAWIDWLYEVCIFCKLAFFSSKSSDLNLRPCSSFSRIKQRIKTNHFWTSPSTMFLSPVWLSSCTSHFHLSPSLSIAFFLVSWASFFSFSISDCLFWVSALDISLISSNLSVMSSTSCLFSERSSPPRPVHLISSLVFD